MSRRTCTDLGVCQARPGCQQCSHDTETLPPSGYYFAPGAIDHEPRRARRISPLGRLVLQCMGVLAFAALVGYLAGVAQAKGWPL